MTNEAYVTIILSVFLIVMGCLLITSYEDRPGIRILGYCLGVLFSFICAVTAFTDTTTEYKHGQIDALNGKVKYHLVRQSDNTMQWERINPDTLRAQKLINE